MKKDGKDMKKVRPEGEPEDEFTSLEGKERIAPKRRQVKPAKHKKRRNDDDFDEGHRPEAERHATHSKLRKILRSSSEEWDDYDD